jgi:hypothetical protein
MAIMRHILASLFAILLTGVGLFAHFFIQPASAASSLLALAHGTTIMPTASTAIEPPFAKRIPTFFEEYGNTAIVEPAVTIGSIGKTARLIVGR